MLTLGHKYEDGNGVEKSLTEALAYYEKAGYKDNEEGAYHAALIHKCRSKRSRKRKATGQDLLIRRMV